jgi:hypothetical protein
MKKIVLSENCFGLDVEINGESLFIHEYDNRNPEIVSNLQDDLINKLKLLKDKLSISDWYEIAQLIVNNNNDEYDYDVENSKEYKHCDQCGNWNHNYIYIKKNKNDE